MPKPITASPAKAPPKPALRLAGPQPPPEAFVNSGDRADIEQQLDLMTGCGIKLRQIRAVLDYRIELQQYQNGVREQ